jgi:hypothetical protein
VVTTSIHHLVEKAQKPVTPSEYVVANNPRMQRLHAIALLLSAHGQGAHDGQRRSLLVQWIDQQRFPISAAAPANELSTSTPSPSG